MRLNILVPDRSKEERTTRMPEAVSFIGVGTMGSTLARTAAEAGFAVSVWNRSPAKAEALAGVVSAVEGSAAAAVQASPLSVVCLTRYEHAYEALDGIDLDGRTLVNLSWGTPDDAAEMSAWVEARGGEYLDGGIPVYPSGIGRPETELVFSGPDAPWARYAPVLKAFGGASRLVSSDLGAANAICLALPGGFYHLAFAAFFEAAAYAASCGFPMTELRSQVKSALSLLESSLDDSIAAIESDEYPPEEVTLWVQLDAMLSVRDAMQQAGQKASLVGALIELFERGVADGRGDLACASIFPMLRDGR
jgi:3-hydroxyisobutyrate dehydrogenase-like beta-hydroxyacid dehydrogenase